MPMGGESHDPRIGLMAVGVEEQENKLPMGFSTESVLWTLFGFSSGSLLKSETVLAETYLGMGVQPMDIQADRQPSYPQGPWPHSSEVRSRQ